MPEFNNFSTAHRLPADDERQEFFAKQRAERGFDDTELWNLDTTITRFILPRLKAFAHRPVGVPYGLEREEWQQILDDMIAGFEAGLDDHYPTISEKDAKMELALDLFCRHFYSLWY